MPPGGGYPIEDFLEAITAQLDQTQDALRLKAVNRPLTFALKDFNVDLKVFVEMDAQGRVNFRPAGPNEDGASTVSIGFTTITRPMIEENTISMEMAQTPSLDELGLKRDEQRQLAKIGVRNAAQLKNLQRSAGEDTLSRHTGIDLGRIRGALNLARPRLEDIGAEPAGDGMPGALPDGAAVPPVGRQPDFTPAPAPWHRPEIRPEPRPGPVPEPRPAPAPAGDPGVHLADRLRQRLQPRIAPAPATGPSRRLEIDPGARNIRIAGRNLIEEGRGPAARLDGRPLALVEASALAASFALPPGRGGGRLTIELPDGATESFDLVERPPGTGAPR
ncbi:hypothetical protein [Amaricoccus sp.]|uniref:hypothetical protein n=1 Tax=Amaricoccus sp. TaxID=1872485 RepID=UPI002C419752|nr:hypothetical protein [Amaricoccus sp.]HRW14349.1 hypothetical protein [Amaricoccus sp.]